MLLDRYVGTVLAIFLFAMAGFLNYYRAPVRPNILRHGYILAGYFSVQAVAMFLTNVIRATAANANLFAGIFGTDPMTWINRGLMIGSTACFLAWTFLLTRSGEGLPISAALSASDLASIERRDKELLDILKWLMK